MTRDDFNTFCSHLPATTNVVQWGGASVWKVGDKIFAVYSNWSQTQDGISFKASDIAFEVLSEQLPFRPAPYLGRAKWLQITDLTALPQTDIEQYIVDAHTLVASKLTKKLRTELGLTHDTQ